MIGGRYSIEVSDGIAVIHGNITIAEAFDFLNYFDKQGYSELIPGDQNSVMRLYKPEDESVEPSIPEKNIYESFYEEEKTENKRLLSRLKQLESLIKQLLTEKQTDTPELIKFLAGFSYRETPNAI